MRHPGGHKDIDDADPPRPMIGMLVTPRYPRLPDRHASTSPHLGLSRHCQNFDVANAAWPS